MKLVIDSNILEMTAYHRAWFGEKISVTLEPAER